MVQILYAMVGCSLCVLFNYILCVVHVVLHYSFAVQSQKTVSAYFTSEQILPFGFAEERSHRYVSQVDKGYFIQGTYRFQC